MLCYFISCRQPPLSSLCLPCQHLLLTSQMVVTTLYWESVKDHVNLVHCWPQKYVIFSCLIFCLFSGVSNDLIFPNEVFSLTRCFPKKHQELCCFMYKSLTLPRNSEGLQNLPVAFSEELSSPESWPAPCVPSSCSSLAWVITRLQWALSELGSSVFCVSSAFVIYSLIFLEHILRYLSLSFPHILFNFNYSFY